MRQGRPLVLWLSAFFALSPTAQQPFDTPCGTGSLPRASHDLYCIELAPVPALQGVTGSFELGRIPSPFGVNVNRDGRQQYAPVLRIQGLPEPAKFAREGRYWIAWIATQQLYPVLRLGVV